MYKILFLICRKVDRVLWYLGSSKDQLITMNLGLEVIISIVYTEVDIR